MNRPILHQLVAKGDLAGVREYLAKRLGADDDEVNAIDQDGCTPLVRAVRSERADAEMVRELLSHGACVDVDGPDPLFPGITRSVISLALSGGDPAKVEALIAFGADVCYRRADGTDALIEAVYGRDVVRDQRLIELLELLVAVGVPLSGMSSYGESALRQLSFVGRFDAVKVLLEAGADRDHLGSRDPRAGREGGLRQRLPGEPRRQHASPRVRPEALGLAFRIQLSARFHKSG